jgi:hypothetical protein
LLFKAEGFFGYPKRCGRKATAPEIRRIADQMLQEHAEWRRTFESNLALTLTPTLLDEVYCKELLAAIPSMVERTQQLARLSLANLPKTEAMVYLHEAARCHIYGLSQGAIALSRAAVESCVRDRARTLLGSAACNAMTLAELLGDQRLRPILKGDMRGRAEQVKDAANRALHKEPMTADDALRAVDAARMIVAALANRNPFQSGQ